MKSVCTVMPTVTWSWLDCPLTGLTVTSAAVMP